MRTFTNETSQQAWAVKRDGATLTTTAGKVGGKGRTTTRKFADAIRAGREMNRRIAEKRGEGYVETTPVETFPPLPPQGALLEKALADDPDDLSAHMAYADWLSEQSDERLLARGQLVRTQLALEGEGVPASERRKLKRREKLLLQGQQRLFFGELAPFLLGDRDDDLPEYLWGRDVPHATWTFRRGWVCELELTTWLSVELATALGRAPALRLLRRLVLGRTEPEPFEALGEARVLGNVTVLEVHHCGSGHVHKLIARLPWLEELLLQSVWGADQLREAFRLSSLARLRSLRVEDAAHFPLAELAANPVVGGLERLGLEGPSWDSSAFQRGPGVTTSDIAALVRSPHLTGLRHLAINLSEVGDAGVSEIVSSGILKRLEVLDLSRGTVTDAGARALAACPDVPKLRSLILSQNRITRAGTRALARAGARLTATRQRQPDLADDALWFGDDYE
jgi:uncharacterized protein (TIGR02996 family)